MKILQKKFSKPIGWETLRDDKFDHGLCNIVFAFGSCEALSDNSVYSYLKTDFPAAEIIMSSTAGEIIGMQVNDETISLTAVQFERTAVKVGDVDITTADSSFTAGEKLAAQLNYPGLKHVMIISDGQKVNGSELVRGVQESLPENVIITGGLAGDGARFSKTIVGSNQMPAEGKIVAVGFYGNYIRTSYGSMGGWGPFGPERLITRSKGNVLYELDGKPALTIYKNYLGKYANELPGSGLLFPLSVRSDSSDQPLVRTILSVNEEDNSLTFAGNVPQNTYAKLMKANFDKLIEGAANAAQNSIIGQVQKPDLAILISCVGRKLVLNQRVEEEIEAIKMVYGNDTAIAGFYSYGEISPFYDSLKCELHNQTMTVTTFNELAYDSE